MTQPSGKDLWNSLTGWGGGGSTPRPTTTNPSAAPSVAGGGTTTTTGAPAQPPSVTGGGSSGTTYQQYTAPAGPHGGAFPAGTVYTVGSNGSLSIDYRPPSGGGGSGAVSVSLNPNSTSAWSIREMPDGSLWRINELTGEMVQMTGAPQPYRDPSGYDPNTGLPYGVVRVPTDVSPTGLVYQGKPVNPDGSLYTGSGAGPNYEGTRVGPGGIYGYNPQSGRYELIPGSEALGSGVSNQPATYSGGGGGSGAASAYSSIATAQINAASRLAAIDAESQAAQARMQMEAQLTKELKALDQNFQREMAAMQNTLSAIGLQAQIATANAQLRQAYEQNKIALVGQFQSALQQYDARAVFDAMMEAGSLSSALNQMGEQGFLTDNANAPAAALLSMIRKPFEPIPEPAALAGFLGGAPGGGMTGGLPGGATGGTGGATGGTGGTGGATAPTGGLSGGLGGPAVGVPGIDTGAVADQLRAAGVPESEIAAALQEIAMGQKAAQDYGLGMYYKGQTGNGLFLRRGDQGGEIAGIGTGGAHELQGNYSGVWQTVDPYAPNYKSPNDPMFQPSWATQSAPEPTMAGTGGTFVAPTEPMPANHPLAGGLTGGQVAKNPLEPQAVIPMLKDGGSFRGAAVVGEAGPELMIAPQGADVIPLSPPMAGQLLGSGMPGLAYGTISGGTLTRARSTPTYVEPTPTATTGGSVTTSVPSTTTQVSSAAPPVVSPTSSPAPPVAAPTPAAPAATPTPATQPAPAPATPAPATPTTPLNGSLPQPSQELLDEIMADRMGTANMGINPYDVGFANLPPWIQELFFQNEAQRTGTPAALYAQDVARRQLVGALTGTQGY